jgi:putative ABC transport system permease protein
VEELFGVSMDLIMYVLVALLALSLGSVVFVAVRNQIMFKMGIRNIPRRRAQTVLIVLGLMLSTVIISAAFATGDTVDKSVTSEVYSILGSLDETIEIDSGFDDDEDAAFQEGGARAQGFSADQLTPLVNTIAANPDVDFVIPAYMDVAAAVSPEKRLSSPQFSIAGLDPARSRDLPDLETLGGEQVEVSGLGPGEIYVNESAAEELDIAAGDALTLYALGEGTDFRVKEVVKDRRLAGSDSFGGRREGGVVPLAVAQEMFGAPGQVTMIAVSNRGDARGGYGRTDEVESAIDDAITSFRAATPEAPQLNVISIKQVGVEIAELFGNILATFFLVLGLFSIGAGVLLIFLIFVMLAAERKPEMGMARAVGTKRADLVQTFLAEGMAYNLAAALAGTALGVLVAFVIGEIMAALLSEFDIGISPQVTSRSLVISYSLGVVLTFFTVTFSSWRVSNLNIVRAIRDIPEPPPQKPMWGSRGVWASLRDLFFKPTSKAGWLRRAAISVGLVLLIFGASAPPAALAGVALIAGAFISFATEQRTLSKLFRAGLALLLILAAPASLVVALFMTFQMGPFFILASFPLLVWGASENTTFGLLFGLSLLPLGIALVARSFGANERITYTACGLFLLYVWLFDFSVGLIEKIFGPSTGDIELFFLSGVMITIAATFLVVYNADLILIPLRRIGSAFGALLPSIKMAVAYPLANRTRTGMTMAMFCLVVFALVMMTSMNHNFNRLYLSDRSLGGWDIVVEENPTNPVDDLESALTASGSPAVSSIDVVGVESEVTGRRGSVCQPAPWDGGDCAEIEDGNRYRIQGDDAAFLAATEIPFQTRAIGYSSDRAIWDAIARDPSLVVVDSVAVTGDFGLPVVEGVEPGDSQMEPLPLVLVDVSTGQRAEVTVIGVIEMGASSNFAGLHMSQTGFDALFGEADLRRHYVRTADGTDNVAAARQIESALLTTGAQADSMRKLADDLNATQRGFFMLLQGFMGLGLFVGVAAVGVIAFRTVVERRQQIGMLRAIGYTRGMIGLTFLIESAFIAFMGVLSGIIFAIILARQLVTEEFANQGVTSFSVPFTEIAVIGGLAFGFALLMTLIPSRQAASIPIAQALRYE